MSKNETIHTPAHDLGGHGNTKPTGHVIVDGKCGPTLPPRTTGSNSIEEVTYDENAGLHERTGGK